MMTLDELKKNYKESHTSWTRGYLSRKKDYVIESYKGRFGEGYTVHTPSWKATRYHHVTYFVN